MADGRNRSTANSRPHLVLLYDGARGVVHGERFSLAGEVEVGRTSSSIVQLEDPSVSRIHAVVRVDDADRRVSLIDRSSTGTELNGRAVTRAELSDGDVIHAGDSFLLFRWSPLELAPSRLDLPAQAPSTLETHAALGALAGCDEPVLLRGPVGTGKETLARAMHDQAGREGSFVVVPCAAFESALTRAALVGQVQGATPGASHDAPGLIRAADRGTLVFDEVEQLPEALALDVIRYLDTGTVVPLGSSGPVPCRARVIATSIHPFPEAPAFDALARALAAHAFDIAPLAERREDILPLLLDMLGRPTPDLSPELVGRLLLHAFPFNARELSKMAAELRERAGGGIRLTLDMIASRLDRPSSTPRAR